MLARISSPSIVTGHWKHLLIACPLAACLCGQVLGQQAFQKEASWNWPEMSLFEEQMLSFLDQQQADAEVQEAVSRHWQETQSQQNGPAMIDRLLTAAAFVDARIEQLVDVLDDPSSVPPRPGELEWLSSDIPGWLQDTIRLACGRAFAQRRMYDEALETLNGLELVQVCDPSSLIFYRASSEHHLMKTEECLADIDLLLQREHELPDRFSQVAKLMKADIKDLESDSLDEVSRLMRDVERRLDLGRAGQRVRDEEEAIVKKLDKMIENLEQQLQQQQRQQNANSKSASDPAQAKPMEDSREAGGSGPGDVDRRDVGDRAGWGDLPAADRQESLQRLTEGLPSHYRDVIEGYFRQIAKQKQ